MQDWQKYGIALAVVVLIFAIPFVVNPSAEFGGADDAGAKAIAQQQPGYKPWFTPIWEPPAETASMLFALQAAIGAIVIGYFIGYEKAKMDFGKNKKSTKEKDEKSA